MLLDVHQRNPPEMWGLASCQEGENRVCALAELAGAEQYDTLAPCAIRPGEKLGMVVFSNKHSLAPNTILF